MMKVPASAVPPRSTRLRKGAPWLKTLLIQPAWAAKRKKGSYFNAQFYRLCGRRGPKKAACAVAASLLATIYHMLKDDTQFQDLGAERRDHRSKDAKAKRLVAQLAKLGFDAKLTPLAQAASDCCDVAVEMQIKSLSPLSPSRRSWKSSEGSSARASSCCWWSRTRARP